MILTVKQTITLDALEDDSHKQIIFGGAAGGGKSQLGCYWLIKSCLKYPQTRWLMGRAVLKTLKETTLNSFYDVATRQGLKAGEHYTFNAQSNIITFFNGSQIILKDLAYYPSDANFDDLGSLELTGAFVDEANQLTQKAWSILYSRIRYKLNDYGLIPKLLGTCNPSKGFIYDGFYKPHKDDTLANDRMFVQALVHDNPNISPHYIESLKSLDKASKERLYYGNWDYDDNDNALIQYDHIVNLFSNSYIHNGDSYISADIARFGKDNTVIMVWGGMICTEIHTLSKKSTVDVVAYIKHLAKQHRVPFSRIICDEDGVGGGVVDAGFKGFVNNSKAIKGNYINLKSECYYMLAEAISNGLMWVRSENVSVNEKLIQELSVLARHNADKDGKLAIIPKEKVKELIGRSPDISDALMMRMWFELKYSEPIMMEIDF